MKKRSALIFGLLAVLLAFSMVLTGCPDPNKDDGGGGGGGNPFLGTWQTTIQQYTETLTFNNDGTFTSSWGADDSGTYTVNGNTATMTFNNPSAPQATATINVVGTFITSYGDVYTKVSNPGGPGGGGTFTITGYNSQQITTVTVTTQNPSSLSAWASMTQDVSHIKGIGTKAAGTSTVVWSVTPPNGTYTIIIMYQSGGLVYKKATNVTITNGGGSASSFTTLS